MAFLALVGTEAGTSIVEGVVLGAVLVDRRRRWFGSMGADIVTHIDAVSA
jgi:hypothetical protein